MFCVFAAQVHQCRREGQAAQERAEAAIALATELGAPQWLALATMLRGGALVELGQVEEGMAQIQPGVDPVPGHRGSGRALWAGAAGRGYGKMGQADEGLCVLAEALTQVDQIGGYWCAAELYRLKGELLLALPVQRQAEAETCFHQALDVARRQQAKSRELRAAMSLSRLWQQPGQARRSPPVLAPIYGWFTEGFDTADLQEAKALLEELA